VTDALRRAECRRADSELPDVVIRPTRESPVPWDDSLIIPRSVARADHDAP